MKRLGVFILPPGWDASPSQGYPQHYAGTHLYTWVERDTVRVKCLAQEHNTMSPARPRTQTTRSGVEHTNHEAIANYECLISSVFFVLVIDFLCSKNLYWDFAFRLLALRLNQKCSKLYIMICLSFVLVPTRRPMWRDEKTSFTVRRIERSFYIV